MPDATIERPMTARQVEAALGLGHGYVNYLVGMGYLSPIPSPNVRCHRYTAQAVVDALASAPRRPERGR